MSTHLEGAESEDDVVAAATLPTFNDSLSEEASEELLSLLSVPHIAIPLVLDFFARDRVGSLLNTDLQNIVESVLFEPKVFSPGLKVVTEVPIPAKKRSAFGTAYGVLMQEVLRSPVSLLTPLKNICMEAVKLCVGGFMSSFVPLLLYVVRVTTRVLRYVEAAKTMKARVGKTQSVECIEYTTAIVNILRTRIGPLISKWVHQAYASNDIVALTNLHAHLALIFATDLSKEDALPILLSR